MFQIIQFVCYSFLCQSGPEAAISDGYRASSRGPWGITVLIYNQDLQGGSTANLTAQCIRARAYKGICSKNHVTWPQLTMGSSACALMRAIWVRVPSIYFESIFIIDCYYRDRLKIDTSISIIVVSPHAITWVSNDDDVKCCYNTLVYILISQTVMTTLHCTKNICHMQHIARYVANMWAC